MPDLTKIATCSYCGTRSVLHLAGHVQHELACSACGARLHEMKPLRIPQRKSEKQSRSALPVKSTPRPPHKARARHRAEPLFLRLRDALEDLVDEVEDIFD